MPTQLSLSPLDLPGDGAALADWLSGDRWPYHLSTAPTPAEVAQRVCAGAYSGPDTQTFWLVRGAERVGLLSVQEIRDLTPVFDLRIRSAWRGQNLGQEALGLLARHAFTELGKTRVEGHTRVDNVPMRRTFLKSGWVKEAHYRRCWPDQAGQLHDALTYALLRDDWQRGTQTPVPWEEEPSPRRGGPSDFRTPSVSRS